MIFAVKLFGKFTLIIYCYDSHLLLLYLYFFIFLIHNCIHSILSYSAFIEYPYFKISLHTVLSFSAFNFPIIFIFWFWFSSFAILSIDNPSIIFKFVSVKGYKSSILLFPAYFLFYGAKSITSFSNNIF